MSCLRRYLYQNVQKAKGSIPALAHFFQKIFQGIKGTGGLSLSDSLPLGLTRKKKKQVNRSKREKESSIGGTRGKKSGKQKGTST